MYAKFGSGDVIVTGRVTSRGAEYKPGIGKTAVLKFGLDTGRKQVDGAWQHEFANITVFRELADKLNNRVLPHMSVFVAGRENNREYNGKTYTEVIADFVSIGLGEEEAVEEKFVGLDESEVVDLPF